MTIKCQLCQKPSTHLWRCDKHYRCDDCGIIEDLIFDEGGLLCEPCKTARVTKRLETFDEDTSYRNNLTCPYCGWVMSNSWEVSSDEGEYTCDDCDHIFAYQRVVDISYSTKRMK